MRTLGSFMVGLAFSFAVTTTGCSAQTSEDAGATEDAVTSSKLARSYAGTIANLPIRMRLEVSGSSVRGTYFYEGKPTSGDVIALTGTLVGAKLALEESVKGKKTGAFEGTVGEGGKVKGAWRSPDGRRSLPLSLDAVAAGKPIAVTRTVSDRVALSGEGPFPECTADVAYVEVFGLDDAKAEASINEALVKDVWPLRDASGACVEPLIYESSQTVRMLEGGLLVVAHAGTHFGGGPYTSTSLSWSNFSLATGKLLTLADVAAPGAGPTLKQLVQRSIQARTDVDEEGKASLLDASESAFGQLDAVSFEATKDGLAVSLYDDLPHAVQSLDAPVLLPWSALGGLLAPGTEVAALAR